MLNSKSSDKPTHGEALTNFKELADAKGEWNARTQGLRAETADSVLFQELLVAHLPNQPGLRALEIGALPGRFLAFAARRFGYRVTGVDFSDNTDVFVETMRLNGIDDYEFVRAEFLGWETEQRYDVVMSFGFVEHFDDVDSVVSKHARLVAPGGYLVITMPNFRYLQWLYHRLFDAENLSIHNIRAMNPTLIHAILTRHGLSRVSSGYTGRLELWRHDPGSRIGSLFRFATNRVGAKLPDTKWWSAYQYFIYRRESAG